MCVRERKKQGETVCACVCVCVRERGRERERVCAGCVKANSCRSCDTRHLRYAKRRDATEGGKKTHKTKIRKTQKRKFANSKNYETVFKADSKAMPFCN